MARCQGKERLTRLYSADVVILVGAFSEKATQCGTKFVAHGTHLYVRERGKISFLVQQLLKMLFNLLLMLTFSALSFLK